MTDYSKITALYSRLSVGDEDRDGGESNSIQNQKIFLENYARGQHLTNIRHYIDDDESGRFFDRSAYSRMMDDVENGKIGVCIMKDLTRWGRDYLQVGNAMEIFRRNNVRFIAVNNGIDSEKPDTLEFAPFINIMSEWYAKDISKKVKTGIKTKGMSGKPIATEAPYGYVKDPDNKDFWIIDEEAAEVVRLIFRLFIGGKNRNQIAVYLKNEQIPTPTFYMKDRGRGTCKNKALNEDNRYKWNKATLTHILTRQEYCGDVVNFKTTKQLPSGEACGICAAAMTAFSRQNEGGPMQTINLKQYYPFCTEDTFVEVSDEIVEAFLLDKRAEAARERKMYRYKAHYSLDCDDGIEKAAIGWAQPSPEDYIVQKEEQAEHAELLRRLYEAISSLPPTQARRVHARYMLGMKVKDIAVMEGITPSQAGKSIHAALRRLRRYFIRRKWTSGL